MNKKSTTEISITEGKSMAIIAYITLIGLIIAFVQNQDKKNEFTKFHIVQSLGLLLTGFVLGMIGIIPILGWIIYFFGIFVLLFMWIKGIINAVNGKKEPVPILGKKYIEWFKNI